MYRLPCNVLVVAALCASSAAFAQAPKIGAPPSAAAGALVKAQDRADELFEQGATAYHAGRLSEAEGKLGQAWALKKTHDIAGDLGVVEFKLGKFVLAAEHLAWALQHFPPTESDQARRAFQETLAKTRPQVATLRIRVDIDGADVTVNGRAVGTTPIAADVFLEPGTVTLVARRDGYVAVQRSVTIPKGEARDVSLTLAPVTPARRSLVPAIVLGSASAVGLGVGIATTVLSSAKQRDVDTQRAAILNQGGQCVKPSTSAAGACVQLENTAKAVDTNANAARVAYVTSGVFAIGAVVYVLLPQPKAATTGVWVMPAVGVGSGGVTLVGAW